MSPRTPRDNHRKMASSLSFRARILLIVFGVAVMPLGLLGLWLTRSAARSGEELARSRLEGSLDETTTHLLSHWIRQRSALLFLTEDPGVQQALREGTISSPPSGLARRFEALDASVSAVTVKDVSGRVYWALQRPPERAADLDGLEFTPRLTVPFEVRDRASGRFLGTVEARLSVDGLLPAGEFAPAVAGQVLGLFQPSTGIPLAPLPIDPTLLDGDEFNWGGEHWVATARTLRDPPIRVVAAVPVTPFTQPFESAAHRGTMLLLLAMVTGLTLAGLLANRLTRSLGRLSAAAEAVSRGDLQQRVEVQSDDEVGRVAQAFNTMTASLERTLDQLSSRESLAAVGQFAASLAHEVRNPLTAIRVDLQLVEEGLAQDSALRNAQERALREIARLDTTVSRALTVARSGELTREPIDLREPIQAAVDAALPAFRTREAILRVELGREPLTVQGDRGALEQLFLNLLQNAAQALDRGGVTTVAAEISDGLIEVTVRDSGSGIPGEILDRVFEPLFTTRPEGTGLGLSIARRIARAHGGDLELESTVDRGTLVRVQLPRAGSESASAVALSRSKARM